MKLSGSIVAIPVLGLAAALGAHESLQACRRVGLGAVSYGAHAHASVAPTLAVEAIGFALLMCLIVREAARPSRVAYYRIPTQSPTVAAAVAIAIVAVATLFGMEFYESGTAALGSGWIGGGPLPGVPLLATAVAIATGAHWTLAGDRVRVFERIVAMLAATVSIATAADAGSREHARPGRLRARRSLRHAPHARLRAPPIPTV